MTDCHICGEHINDNGELTLATVLHERGHLKSALTAVAGHVGAAASPECSVDFLCGVAEEVRLVVAALTRERGEWKANHDNQLAIKRAVLDRPDLADQSRSVQVLIAERDQLKAALAAIAGIAKQMQTNHGKEFAGTPCGKAVAYILAATHTKDT